MWKHGRSSSQRGYGAAWQRVRLSVILRDKGLCQGCLQQGIIRQGRDVDHIMAKSQGGTDAMDNLRLLCRRCHADATAALNGSDRPTWAGCDARGVPMRDDHHWRAASEG